MGMTPEQLDRIFQPFTQADVSTTRRHGGTGLGLSISKNLVELMGGRIWAESEYGRGSSFLFTLRCRADNRKPEQGYDPASLRGFRVLVVDDNSSNRRILRYFAEEWGLQLWEASSADEALEIARKNPEIDILWSDFNMPEKDGATLIKELREEKLLPGAKILLMSSSIPENQEAIESLKVDSILFKPLRKRVLFRTMLHLCGRPLDSTEGGSDLNETLIESFPGTRVLVAEDNSVNQKVALLMLRRLGCDAECAGNGLEAVESCRERRFDIVLMDLQMPEMDGIEAAKCIRQELPPERCPKILAMTAGFGAPEIQRSILDCMDGFIHKPVKVEEMRSALREVLTVSKS